MNKKDNKCFQYDVTVALNPKGIDKNPERITEIKSFINKYSWEGTNSRTGKDDWRKLEKNNPTIALSGLYARNEKIYPTYVSKNNSNREKLFIFLMIINGEECNYLAVEKLSTLLTETTSKHHGDFYL